MYTQKQRERTGSYEINDNKSYFKDKCVYQNTGIAGAVRGRKNSKWKLKRNTLLDLFQAMIKAELIKIPWVFPLIYFFHHRHMNLC